MRMTNEARLATEREINTRLDILERDISTLREKIAQIAEQKRCDDCANYQDKQESATQYDILQRENNRLSRENEVDRSLIRLYAGLAGEITPANDGESIAAHIHRVLKSMIETERAGS